MNSEERVKLTLMRIDAFRRRKPKKTLADIAVEMNTTPQSISRIINGKQAFYVSTLFKIAEILDVSVSVLTEGREAEINTASLYERMRRDTVAEFKKKVVSLLDDNF
jgi:transcriptional regulator with XRE-family HTH domain